MKVASGQAVLHLGECLEVLKSMPDASIDAIVTDPPYGLSFMGKKWDYDVPSVEIWAECLRVLKPGGHLLAFAGTRTQHRMAVRIEDAGFEIRDMIAWVYGSGFPKSLDVSKAIDKAAGALREQVGPRTYADGTQSRKTAAVSSDIYGQFSGGHELTAPATEAATKWEGWGTALKPALEPITVARKPLVGTVAGNVLEWGTGAINVDGCRVESEVRPLMAHNGNTNARSSLGGGETTGAGCVGQTSQGRWPANLIHDGSEEVLTAFPDVKTGALKPYLQKSIGYEGGWGAQRNVNQAASNGSAARFFYCAKADRADRGDNEHPTVKPTDLMRYLCRLVTPLGGVVLDPFMGSGSTGKAAKGEGFQFIGIEREPKYFDIACKRIEQAVAQGQLFAPERPAQIQEGLEL